MKDHRVVITGMGVISPVGLDVPTMWQNLIAGRSGIAPITLFETNGFGARIAGEAHGFDPTDHMAAKDVRRTDRFTQFAIAALNQALARYVSSSPLGRNRSGWLFSTRGAPAWGEL